MKIERRDGSQERRILTAMIVDDGVLGRLSGKWTKEGLFGSRWSNIVAEWCVTFYNLYGHAPRKSILGLFENWAEDSSDTETVNLIESFISGLSEDYEADSKESNTDYILDIAGKHFDKIRLSRLAEAIQADLDRGDVDKARSRHEKSVRVEVSASQGVNVLSDVEAIKKAFSRKSEPIVTYPGALGNFFADAFERDALIAFQGPEKRGKTYWLLDVAWRAMMQGRRVAFFEVGDMSEWQILLRFMVRAAKRPLKATDPTRPLRVPISIDKSPESPFAVVEVEEHVFNKKLRWKEAYEACRRLMRKNNGQDLLKLATYANGTIGVQGIMSLIDSWEREGWGTPDVIVIDYADLLSPPHGFVDSRDQINATWKGLRRMSQEYHALVVTATQADADSYTAETQTMANFSEDKRKNAHVTGIVGINQTPSEKSQGIQRLNWLALRQAEFSSDQNVHVAGCLGISNPAMYSIF